MNYSKQSLQFQIGQIGDSEKRILKYGKQLTPFELQRSSCFLKSLPQINAQYHWTEKMAFSFVIAIDFFDFGDKKDR